MVTNLDELFEMLAGVKMKTKGKKSLEMTLNLWVFNAFHPCLRFSQTKTGKYASDNGHKGNNRPYSSGNSQHLISET